MQVQTGPHSESSPPIQLIFYFNLPLDLNLIVKNNKVNKYILTNSLFFPLRFKFNSIRAQLSRNLIVYRNMTT